MQTSPDGGFVNASLTVENKQKTTAAYLTGYPEVGTYFWRVSAELSSGYATAWSPVRRYQVAGVRRR